MADSNAEYDPACSTKQANRRTYACTNALYWLSMIHRVRYVEAESIGLSRSPTGDHSPPLYNLASRRSCRLTDARCQLLE